MRGTECSIEQRRGAGYQELDGPIPSSGGVARAHSAQGGGRVADGPGPMPLPQRDPPSLGEGENACLISRGNRDMGRFGAAGEVSDFCPLGGVYLFTRLVRPCARPHQPHQDVSTALAPVEQKFGRSVCHNRKTQLGIGRHGRRISHVGRTSQEPQNFPEARFADPRRGGGQAEDSLGEKSRGAESHTRSPFVAHFSIPCPSFRQSPYLETPARRRAR